MTFLANDVLFWAVLNFPMPDNPDAGRVSEETRSMASVRILAQREFFLLLIQMGKLDKDNADVFQEYGACFRVVFDEGRFDADHLTCDEYDAMRMRYQALEPTLKFLYGECLARLERYMIDAAKVDNKDDFAEKKFGLAFLVLIFGSVGELEKFLRSEDRENLPELMGVRQSVAEEVQQAMQ